MLCLISTLLIQLKISPTKGKQVTSVRSARYILPAGWIESMMDLPVTVAVLIEHTKKEFQFSWETFLVADGSSMGYTKLDSIECLLAGW